MSSPVTSATDTKSSLTEPPKDPVPNKNMWERIGSIFDRSISREEVANHAKMDDAWIIIDGKVYDITHFKHPGGQLRFARLLGKDASTAYHFAHPNLEITTLKQPKYFKGCLRLE